MIIFNITSAEIKTKSTDVLLKMILTLKKLRIVQLCSYNGRTLGCFLVIGTSYEILYKGFLEKILRVKIVISGEQKAVIICFFSHVSPHFHQKEACAKDQRTKDTH